MKKRTHPLPNCSLYPKRLVLAIACKEKYIVHQMGVKSAFLNGKLIVHMKQPEGFEKDNIVCKLNKTLYSMKQASKGWNEKFNNFRLTINVRLMGND